MPGGEAAFLHPPTWEVRDVIPFSPGTQGSSGSAEVYTDEDVHLLHLVLVNEPWSFDCAGPAPRSSVLHADPLESALATADGGELATEVRFDALGAIGSLTISLTDGQTGEGACALDTSAAVTPGDNGIVGVAFGTGSPGPGLLSPPPFASASRALELVDQDLVAVAWATVRSLEVVP